MRHAEPPSSPPLIHPPLPHALLPPPQGAKGFVTFKKRLPANWQAKADAAQQAAEAAEGDAAAEGPLRLAFLAALALALVGACVGESQGHARSRGCCAKALGCSSGGTARPPA